MAKRKTWVRVGGLDLAAVNSGFCAIEATPQPKYPPLEYKLIAEHAFKIDMKSVEAQVEGSKQILEKIKACKLDFVVLEGYALRMGATNTSGYQHGEIGGMLKLRFFEAGIPFMVVPPTTMRSYANCPPRSPKELLMDRAYENYSFSSKAPRKGERSNVCDGFHHACIGALVHFAHRGELVSNLKDWEKNVIYGNEKNKITGLLYRAQEGDRRG